MVAVSTDSKLVISLDESVSYLLNRQAEREGKLPEKVISEVVTDYLTGKLTPKDSIDERLERTVQNQLNSLCLECNLPKSSYEQ